MKRGVRCIGIKVVDIHSFRFWTKKHGCQPKNPLTPAAATRKLRKLTDKKKVQARNHEISDEFRPAPVRHLDLPVDTPAYYYYRKNLKG